MAWRQRGVMLKAVFRPSELTVLPDRIEIESPTSYPDLAHLAPIEEIAEDIVPIEEYTGPTADDLRREAEFFKANWEDEKERMIFNANAEAEQIIKDAQEAAVQEVQRRTDEGLVIKKKAEEEAGKIIADANRRAAEIESVSKQTVENERKEARDKGREAGHEAGFTEGKSEVERLIQRTQVMLERAQDKRAEILAETEQEIIDLVLLLSRKVIKIISENQRSVIISNVVQALRKIKARGSVTIRVNMSDLKLTTEHKQKFIQLVEGVNNIQIVEDGTVDSGGCIIETDFGEIDARISSQLAELESKILEISPIKSRIKRENPLPSITPANLVTEQLADLAEEQLVKQPANPDEGQPADDFADSADEMSAAANAALTASAALAALATMGTKGRRQTDEKMIIT